MNELTAQVQSRKLRHIHYLLPVVIGLILIFAGLLLIQSWSLFTNQDDVVRAIEERYGIHITMLGVTAGGGAVDFRYRVVDPDKASVYLHGTTDLPVLISESNGARIEAPTHMHSTAFQYGVVYYTLYGNPRGVIQPGSKVTVMLGDLRLKHVVAH